MNLTVGVAALAFAACGDTSAGSTAKVTTVPASTLSGTNSDRVRRTQPSLATADWTALLGTWTDGTNQFEFRPDGTVMFTYRTSCEGSFDVRNDILTVDFAGCTADAVRLSAPIFRNAVVVPAESGRTIVLDGDAGRYELVRTA